LLDLDYYNNNAFIEKHRCALLYLLFEEHNAQWKKRMDNVDDNNFIQKIIMQHNIKFDNNIDCDIDCDVDYNDNIDNFICSDGNEIINKIETNKIIIKDDKYYETLFWDWFYRIHKKTEDDNDFIQIKNISPSYRSSLMCTNMKPYEIKKKCQNNIIKNYFAKSDILKLNYKEKFVLNKKVYRCSLLRWIKKI
jgi:hypothetical protein